MMRNFKFMIVGILTISAIAFAVRQGVGSVERVNSPKPQHFVQGMFVGSDSKDPLSTTKNKRAYHLCGTLEYDFPSVTALGAGSACQDSAALTITGCAFNDVVTLGIDQGPPANLNGQLPIAYISAADTGKVRICNGSSDGGAVDYPDASYTICCDGD